MLLFITLLSLAVSYTSAVPARGKHLTDALYEATSDNANVKGYSVTMNGKTFQTPSARDQLAQYLASNLTSFSKSRLNTTLFVVLVGGNDFFFNFLASPNSASTTVGSIVTQLRTAGQFHIMVSTCWSLNISQELQSSSSAINMIRPICQASFLKATSLKLWLPTFADPCALWSTHFQTLRNALIYQLFLCLIKCWQTRKHMDWIQV